MSLFHLSYAVDRHGISLLPIAALRLKSSSLQHGYQCPECKAPVQRYAEIGGKQTPHFRHASAGAAFAGCCFGLGGGESAVHRRACHDVKAALMCALGCDEVDQGLHIEVTCAIHGQTRLIPWRPSSREIRIDQVLPKSTRSTDTPVFYRPDVVVFDNEGRVDLIVEIRHSHEISQAKIDYFAQCGFDWIEVLASDIDATTRTLRARRHAFAMPCCANPPIALKRELPLTTRSPLPDALSIRENTRALGRTPWGTILAWDGRRWRDLPIDS